jgi:hypothetical protein
MAAFVQAMAASFAFGRWVGASAIAEVAVVFRVAVAGMGVTVTTLPYSGASLRMGVALQALSRIVARMMVIRMIGIKTIGVMRWVFIMVHVLQWKVVNVV